MIVCRTAGCFHSSAPSAPLVLRIHTALTTLPGSEPAPTPCLNTQSLGGCSHIVKAVEEEQQRLCSWIYSARSSAVMAAAFLVLFAHLWIISLCGETKTARPGEDFTLHCQYHKDGVINLLEWSRADLKLDDFVFFVRNKRSFEDFQNPSYHGRVELIDPDMKNGDASVVLKNVNINDTGTYECRVGEKKAGRTKRNTPEVINTIKLTVTDSDHTAGGRGGGGAKDGGNMRGHTGLLVSAGLIGCVGAVVVLGFRVRNRLMRKNSEQPADVEAGDQDTLENLNSKKNKCLSDVTE